MKHINNTKSKRRKCLFTEAANSGGATFRPISISTGSICGTDLYITAWSVTWTIWLLQRFSFLEGDFCVDFFFCFVLGSWKPLREWQFLSIPHRQGCILKTARNLFGCSFIFALETAICIRTRPWYSPDWVYILEKETRKKTGKMMAVVWLGEPRFL